MKPIQAMKRNVLYFSFESIKLPRKLCRQFRVLQQHIYLRRNTTIKSSIILIFWKYINKREIISEHFKTYRTKSLIITLAVIKDISVFSRLWMVKCTIKCKLSQNVRNCFCFKLHVRFLWNNIIFLNATFANL